ncbi:hypothetical protein PM10SUCC1_07690 [Propionigenium maris DSM 9537]|uniref:Lipoprotein n=1 Tax=Propionigenium maris DSM 9537 TaxID=1123000 RepID=A0A9W6GHC5_9FUSO|nr:hypothetical protein [Propionigenium maris]GLI55254.1 hypothetical protein PM10SUCC1_07690 [Propionigenium maris DSM 9537]
MRNLIYMLMAFFMVSCASVHPGKYGKSIGTDGGVAEKKKVDLLVSGDTDKAFSNDYYKFMVFTFENKSGEIGEVTEPHVSFEDDYYNSEIRVISGKELKQWHDAQSAEKERREKNRKTAFGGSAIAGGLLSFADGAIGNAGTALLVGGAGALGVDNLHKGNRDAERGKVFPETHLMSGEFQIPAGLYERRWVVFNLKDKEKLPKEILLTYKYNGLEETMAVPLKW